MKKAKELFTELKISLKKVFQKNNSLSGEQTHRLEIIKDTPFTKAIDENNMCHILIGQNRLTPEKIPIKNVKKYIEKRKWDIIMQMALVAVNYELQNNKDIVKWKKTEK